MPMFARVLRRPVCTVRHTKAEHIFTAPAGFARFLVGIIVICTIAVSLEACGFRLRGSGSALGTLPPVYIATQGADSTAAELRRTLSRAGVAVVDDPSIAGRLVRLSGEAADRQVLSVGASGRVQEYTLHFRVNFEIAAANGTILLPAEEIVLSRDLFFSETEVLSKEAESELLYDEMRRMAVQNIIRRLEQSSPGGG